MIEFLLPVILFAIAASFTPGPNNLLLMASGISFGFRRTLPHVIGITFGFPFLVVVVGFGLGEIFDRLPLLQPIMKTAFVIYFLYLAWILLDARPGQRAARKRPMTFLESAAFQWINPKAWLVISGAIVTYARQESHLADVLSIALIFLIVSPFAASSWSFFGQQLAALLADRKKAGWLNRIVAALLVASLVMVIML